MFKRLSIFLPLLFILLTSSQTVKASHVLGGEIRWECLSNGRYVFYLDVYVNCARNSAYWNFIATSLNVSGSPLPRNLANSFIANIPMQPDSNKWQNNRNGDLTPLCDENNPNQISCGAQGTRRVYYYKSSAMVLKGVPPANGWTFVYQPPCCRPDVENLVSPTSNTMNLRAIMYPTANNQNVNPCIDSSPEFRALPVSMICKEYTYTYNHSAIDKELDSIAYAWDRTYNTYPNQPATYRNPLYNYNYPTPGPSSFNTKNIAATLDPITGRVRLAVYSGNMLESYLTVVRADAYRDGVRIASIFREIPFIFFDCPPIDSMTPNEQPDFYYDNLEQNTYEISVEAGEKIDFPIQLMDQDTSSAGLPQELTLIAQGEQFSSDFVDTAFCANPPCAVLKNHVPQYDSSLKRYQISGTNTLTTNFEWQTDCNHLYADGSQKSYYFYLTGKDDHCPIPQQVDTYIKVNVGAAGYTDKPEAACVSDFEDKHLFSWTAGPGLEANFTQWYIYAANRSNQLQLIDSIADFNTRHYEDTVQYKYYQVRTTTNCRTSLFEYRTQKAPLGYQKNPIDVSIVEQNRILSARYKNADKYEWLDCNADTILSDLTGNFIAPQDSGSYAVIITDGYCRDTSDCINIYQVGLSSKMLQSNIKVFPNPSNGLLNIQSSLVQESLHLKVRNIHGQLVQEKHFVNQSNIQFQLLGESGIYFVELINEKGERANVKVVKQ